MVSTMLLATASQPHIQFHMSEAGAIGLIVIYVVGFIGIGIYMAYISKKEKPYKNAFAEECKRSDEEMNKALQMFSDHLEKRLNLSK